MPSRGASSAPATGTPKDPAQPQQNGSTPQQDDRQGWLLIVAEALLFLSVLALIIAIALRILLSQLRQRAAAERKPEPPKPAGPTESPDPLARPEGNVLVRQAPPEVVAQPVSKVDAVVGWLPLIAVGFFIAALGFVAALVAWWFAVLVVLAATALAGPSSLREILRQRHLGQIARRSPHSADAVWAELRAECADRGLPIPESDTVRVAGQKLAQRHHLDDEARSGLRAVIGAVERSWYGEDEEPDPALPAAFGILRDGLRRNAPMSWRGRLFPKSVLNRR